ncbi:hypothetical protein ACPXCX_41180 [Streptomyces sp. DT225]
MLQRPQRGDPLWIWVLHGWEALSWGLVALVTLVTMAGGSPGDRKLAILGLTALIAACYAWVRLRPGSRVPGPYGYLSVLAAGLGLLAYLGDGFGALYTVVLAQFIVFVDSPRGAVLFAGLGALGITVGGSLREGGQPEVFLHNTLS